MWIRIKLLGEIQAAFAKEYGYGSGMAIHQIVKRLEKRSQTALLLKKNLELWIQKVLTVDE